MKLGNEDGKEKGIEVKAVTTTTPSRTFISLFQKYNKLSQDKGVFTEGYIRKLYGGAGRKYGGQEEAVSIEMWNGRIELTTTANTSCTLSFLNLHLSA